NHFAIESGHFLLLAFLCWRARDANRSRDRFDPLGDQIQYVVVNLLLRAAEFLWCLERMIATVDDAQLGLDLQALQGRRYFIRTAERVTLALHDQKRNLDGGQMLDPQLIRL